MDSATALLVSQLLLAALLGVLCGFGWVIVFKIIISASKVLLPIALIVTAIYLFLNSTIFDYVSHFINRHGLGSIIIFSFFMLIGIVSAVKRFFAK
jgi:hypothetical protein